MNKTQEYIELMRNKLESDFDKKVKDVEIYTRLNVRSQTFSRYKRGERPMPNEMAFAIADYVQLPPEKIIGEIQAEQATNDIEKKWWLNLSKKGVAGIAGAFMLSSTLMTPNDAIAKSSVISSDTNYILYELAKRIIKTWYTYSLRDLSHFAQSISKDKHVFQTI